MIRAFLKMVLIALLMLGLTTLAWVFLKCKKLKWRDRTMSLCSRSVLWAIGVRVQAIGAQTDRRPLLVVANHLTYLDVPVLNSYAHVHFTPKAEMGSWPFFGWMCRVQGSVFVDRRPEKVKEVRHDIHAALSAGGAVCLFPEATTGNGLHMLPFKSSFFSLAEEGIGGQELVVQPVSIAYTHLRNLPIDMTQWPDVAWYGDMEMMPHLWNLLKIAPLNVRLTYHEPVTVSLLGDRKKLAAHCQNVISLAIKS